MTVILCDSLNKIMELRSIILQTVDLEPIYCEDLLSFRE